MDIYKEKNRILYYDAIKALAIYLVCLYHYSNLPSNILDHHNFVNYVNYFFHGMPSMAVPLFFMVNGSLLLNKPYTLKNHLNKILYLYILVFTWSFISLIAFIPLEGQSDSLKDFIKALFYFKQGVSNHLWFLQTLISIYLLFSFIKKIYDSPQQKLLHLFCFIVFLFSFGNMFLNILVNLVEFIFGFNYFKNDSFDFFPIINPFGNYYYSFFYFIVGGILSKNISNNKIILSMKWSIISFFLALFMLFLYGLMMTVSNNVFYDTVWNGYYSIMTLVMSISTFLFFSKLSYKIEKINRFLVMISSNTLGIYLIHRFVGAATIPYFHNLILSSTLPVNILYGFFVMLNSLLIVIILKKVPLLRKTVDI